MSAKTTYTKPLILVKKQILIFIAPNYRHQMGRMDYAAHESSTV